MVGSKHNSLIFNKLLTWTGQACPCQLLQIKQISLGQTWVTRLVNLSGIVWSFWVRVDQYVMGWREDRLCTEGSSSMVYTRNGVCQCSNPIPSIKLTYSQCAGLGIQHDAVSLYHSKEQPTYSLDMHQFINSFMPFLLQLSQWNSDNINVLG